jgi:hypothetical protein
MRRLLIAIPVSLALVLGWSTGVADAGKPANQACVGESLSALAVGSAGAFGAGVVGFAQEPDVPERIGLGDNLQVFQAGVVPDEIVPNTCND